jgi:hypothetical protein
VLMSGVGGPQAGVIVGTEAKPPFDGISGQNPFLMGS